MKMKFESVFFKSVLAAAALTGASAGNAMAEYVDGLEITGKATVIGGRGTASLSGCVLTVAVPEKLDFVWVRLD